MTRLLAVALVLVGCSEDPPAPPPPPADASVDGRRPITDTGPPPTADADVDAAVDASFDAAVDASFDAADAAVPSPTINGIIEVGEWPEPGSMIEGSYSFVDITTTWPGNDLRGLRAFEDGEFLWVGLDARIASTNAIVLLFDVDGTAGGVIPMDVDGPLDRPLSANSAWVFPADFLPDFGWGTIGMMRAAVGRDLNIGWRELTDPVDFTALSATDAPAICGGVACETRIPLSSLGVASGDVIRLFARVGGPDGDAFSNQTLPEDNGLAPEIVTMMLAVTVR